ncbi:MAG: hypothetical protein BWY89_02024 [Bacteroidetes bacterium ADurb.BinA012]|nr:MAG: hypothetical protein BWY89_02024 [Bacteroidetes bacterium ADurb.BinA012]
MSEARIIILNLSPSIPVHAFAERREVLKEPYDISTEAPASEGGVWLLMFTEAPKAPAPLVDVPTPRCTCTLPVDDARSGRSTQNTCCDSESLSGIPSRVMLIRLASVPRMRMEV